MEHWEFLLQKAGDHAWLPLEPPDAEILEGQYQVLARSNLIDQTINIRVNHWFDRNGVPEQELQEFSQTTNSEGVVVVVPFTYFRAGLWQLSCVLGEVEGTWHQSIQLQVLHQDTEASEDWDVNWQVQPHDLVSPSSQPTHQKDKVHMSHEQAAPIQSRSKREPLNLPNFKRQSSSQRPKVSEGGVFPPQAAQSHLSNAAHKSPELPVIPRSKTSPAQIEMVRNYLEKAHFQTSTSISDSQPLLAETETAFEALRLKERFWSNLSTLAKKTEAETLSGSDVSQNSVNVTPVDLDTTQNRAQTTSPIDAGSSQDNQPDAAAAATETSNQTLTQGHDSQPDIGAAATEIPNQIPTQSQDEVPPVIIPERLSSVDSQPSTTTAPAELTSDEMTVLPTPSLVLPEEELVMGQVISVRVTLPNLSVPVYVKLWINDRQTRSLLDGPRWLIEFSFNQSLGVLEATTQLMVPLGLEISFEAIAVDMQTKRESYKATVNRPVMPLGLFLVEDPNP